jgi:hypothetical protein
MDTEAQLRAAWCELVHDVARSRGEVQLKAAGASMLPVLWPGDLVSVRRCDFSHLQPGQIILHGQRQNLTLHRIVQVAADHLITRGDSLPDCDPPVMCAEILGRVLNISRNGLAVSPEQAPWQRVVAWILRRSHFLRRAAVYLHRRRPRMKTSPASTAELPRQLPQ